MNKFLIVLGLIFFSQNSFAQLLSGYVFSSTNKSSPFSLELAPFSTDGCTKFDDGPPENPTLWQHCCVDHDLSYWHGGTDAERLKVDRDFYQCIKHTGESSPARLMYTGVRAAGGPLNNYTFRWGFGWNRIRDYAPLTREEKNMAYAMYGENLEDIKKLITQKSLPIVVPENYQFVSPFPYSYCDEQIINYLSNKLTSTATVTEAKAVDIGSTHMIRVNLDVCEDALEFEFSNKTDSRTCKKDYAYSNDINKIIGTNISKKCLEKLRGN